ncbi:MAG: sigma-54 dependent transcriptional regulator [Acidobacteriota bacterium]|nr:sigma-54 dependent transcriptional regulator [Acidobacteriota bacterium]
MGESQRRQRVLVIDDEDSVREQLGKILQDEGYEVSAAASGEDGVRHAVEDEPDVVFLDVWLPGMDGLEALRSLRERGVVAPVIMISGHGTIDTAVRATKLGAYDFVEKPMSLERVLLVTGNALRQARLELRNRALRTELRREAEFLGRSGAVETLRAQLAEATDGAPVLLFGEKGTGRRLAARWLAMHGPRPDGPFLDVQVSALPRERLIRALYGETGREARDLGRMLLADEGTLYMENADMLPLSVQSSLAAGIRSGVYPVPRSRRSVRSEPRLVLSLLDAPEKLVEEGRLSGDFLGVFRHTIEIPSLRRRSEDLPELAERFLEELSREYAREPLFMSPEALSVLLNYGWPGNVRELKRVVERLVLLARGPNVGVEDLPAHVCGKTEASTGDIADTLVRFEAGWIRRQLAEANGDLGRAAAKLGITKTELVQRMERLGLHPEGSGG